MSSKSILASSGLVAVIAAAFVTGRIVGGGGPLLPYPRAQALSAVADESFAVCTTSIDGAMEAVFMLDFQTGDLTGGVLNPNTAKFTTTYRRSVLQDLGFKPGQVKQPRFLLVPGRAAFTGNQGNRMAQSALYVTDASTGVTAAYAIPWPPQQAPGQKPGPADLVLLDVARPRGGAAGP